MEAGVVGSVLIAIVISFQLFGPMSGSESHGRKAFVSEPSSNRLLNSQMVLIMGPRVFCTSQRAGHVVISFPTLCHHWVGLMSSWSAGGYVLCCPVCSGAPGTP